MTETTGAERTKLPEHLTFRRRTVTLLLGSDQHIHRETRVGLTPEHLTTLARALRAHGLEPAFSVLTGAGERAGFADADYRAAGAEVVDEASLRSRPPADVVHALKEPTAWESRLPGPFLRIGALHLASKPPGVCQMLGRRNFGAIVDGGTVGNCSYLLDGGDRTPIVGSMSRFAGKVAAMKLVQGVTANGLEAGTVVIVGGGIAGLAAAEHARALAARLVVVERYRPLYPTLRRALTACGYRQQAVSIVETLDDHTLDDAVGVVFAHRSGAKAAEKVCDLTHIRRMRRGAGIADIAIDQGGSVRHDGYCEEDDAIAARAKYRQLFGDDFYYYAEVNMPREEPHDASIMHGDSVWRYIETLLLLCAIGGGPAAALASLRTLPPRVFTERTELGSRGVFDCLVQDLRNGLQLAVVDGELSVEDPDIAADPALNGWIDACAGR